MRRVARVFMKRGNAGAWGLRKFFQLTRQAWPMHCIDSPARKVRKVDFVGVRVIENVIHLEWEGRLYRDAHGTMTKSIAPSPTQKDAK